MALNCSHNHSGPVVGRNLEGIYFLDETQWKHIDQYTAWLQGQVVAVVGEAIGNLVKCSLAWGQGRVDFAVNRRNNKHDEVERLRAQGQLEGPVDHDLPVLRVTDTDGHTTAIVFGYACHPTKLTGNYRWCGDYVGYAQLHLEKAHPGAVAMFWQGCCGDQTPWPRGGDDYAKAEKVGRQLADAACATLSKPLTEITGSLTTRYAEFDLKLDELPDQQRLNERANSKNRYEARWAKRLMEQIDSGKTPVQSYPYPVQVWQLGCGLTFVLLGGEVVVDYAVRLKAELGAERTWVAGYTNDVMTYIPSRRVRLEGGYEGTRAMMYYGLPSVWAPEIEEVIVAKVHELATTATIENGALRVGVDPHDGKLLELVDLGTKHNHVDSNADSGGLWELNVHVDGQPTVLTPSQSKSFRWEIMPKGQTLRLTWTEFELSGASGFTVEVTVGLEANALTSQWQIALTKPAEVAVRQIRFPRVFGLSQQENERLAVPAWLGQKANDPRSMLGGKDGRGRRLAWDYPGRMALQCLAYYGEGGSGLYAACDDTAARRKTFALWGATGGQVNYETVHYPENGATDQARYALPYRVLLGTFQGDWITAAERYRTWATDQRWAKESRLRKGLVADWVLDTGAWIWNRGPSPGVLPPAAALQKRLGLPVSVFWHWWHGCAYDIGFPEYLPPREGTEAFKQAAARAHDDGVRFIVYMNQRAWGMSSRSWKEEGAERFAVKGPDGRVRPEVYNIFTRQALASMCLATPFWRNKYAGLAEEAFKDLGVDGIYMDQACSHRACYDPNHGHPLGGGNSWMEGFRTLSNDIRNRTNADGRIVLAGEGCGEAWLPYLDLMLTLQVSRERYSSPTDPWEVIPFFQAVYHSYAVTYGSYSSLTMPPYDELWPAEFAPKQPLALLDRKYSRQFYLEQARAFVWGQQPALANFRPEHFDQRPEEIEYVMRLARVRSRATKYLLHGEFLRPPQLNAPEVTSDFSRLSIYAGQKSRLTSSQKQHPLAIAGAWRASDGDVAIALASIAEQALSLSLALDPAYYDLPKHAHVYRIDEAGRHPIGSFTSDKPTLKLELPPRQAWIIEFTEE